MGYSYTMSGALCCDNCGKSGRVKKIPCPHGSCPSAALCPKCQKTVTIPHTHCAAFAADMRAREAREAEIVATGGALRCSAMQAGPGRVHVLFRTSTGTVGYYMTDAAYKAIPLLHPATPDDYRQHCELTTAPPNYNWTHA